MTLRWARWCLVFIAALICTAESAAPYYGTKIGSFKTYAHDVVGDVFAVDDRTIFIKGFSYDGQGPDAYFWGGSTTKPDTSGFIIPDEKGKKTPLKEYRIKDLLLRLPAGKTLRNINWISVWCRKFSANFGEIFISANLLIPQPVEIGGIPTKEHGVSSGPVMVVDTQTLLVPEFTYDGLGPAAYWWVSRGSRQHPRGLRLADENGSFAPLRKYTGKTVVITLPDDHTIYDYDWFGVWCEEARVDFGSVALPQNIVVPPSPRTLGIELEYKLNCEVLHDDIGFEIRWIMDGEDIVMQFVGRIEPGEYMSFGLSKNDTKSEMIKADVIVAWIDKKKKGHAVDYYLGSKEPCVGRRGSCPDAKFPDGQDSVTLLNAAVVNGYTMITLKRPQVGLDEKYDQHIYSDGPQAVVWAVGPLNDKDEVSYHGILRSEGDIYVDFARPPEWNCPQPADPEKVQQPTPSTTTTTTKKPTKRPSALDRSRKPKPTSESSRRKPQPIGPRYASRASDVRLSASNLNAAWNVPPVVCPSDRTFRAQIGPTGGKKGYQSITGEAGWGIAWYINGVLIPEITVERGKTYTFMVEGGNDPENQAKMHPLYITDDPEGGFEYKTSAERKKVKVYAGVSKDRRGTYSPTAMGRLCEWKLPNDLTADDFSTFDEFQESLELKCDRGKAGRLTFKPDKDTPDLLYYHCYTHRYLGWKIHVVDSCTDSKGLRHEASIQHIRNITYNTFTEDDYGREGEKKAAFEDILTDDYVRPAGNDGIPLDVYSSHKEVNDYDKELVTEDPEDRKRLYYRPPSSYYSSQKYYYSSSTKPPPSSLYYKPSTTSSRNQYYPTTQSKSLYYKTSTTTRPPTTSTTTKKPTPTMESFKMRDVVDLNKKKVNYYINTPPTQKPTSAIKTIILNPGQPGNLKLRVFISTPSPHPTQPSYTQVKGRSQWWNQPTQGSATHQKAINNLRTQLSVIQNTKQGTPSAINNPTYVRQPFNTHYEKSFIPVVIKHNSTFDAVVSRAPSHNPHFHQHVNPPSQILALSTTNHNGKSIVPVLIRAKETIKRTSSDTNRNRGIHTPLGNLPYPNSPTKTKPVPESSAKSGDPSYLPLLVPEKPSNKSSFSTKKKSTSPLIPLVIPEKKNDNLYILHQMLSLLNENPQSIAARGIKIVGSSDKNIRTRVIRNADHNHKHSMTGHEHEDHDHNHEGHEMHHKDHSEKSSGAKYSLSRFLFLSALLFIRYFKRMLF